MRPADRSCRCTYCAGECGCRCSLVSPAPARDNADRSIIRRCSVMTVNYGLRPREIPRRGAPRPNRLRQVTLSRVSLPAPVGRWRGYAPLSNCSPSIELLSRPKNFLRSHCTGWGDNALAMLRNVPLARTARPDQTDGFRSVCPSRCASRRAGTRVSDCRVSSVSAKTSLQPCQSPPPPGIAGSLKPLPPPAPAHSARRRRMLACSPGALSSRT